MIKLIGIDFDETLAKTQDLWRHSESEFYNLVAQAGATREQLIELHDKFSAAQTKNVHSMGFGCGLQLKTLIDLSLDVVPALVNAHLLEGINEIVQDLRHQPFPFFDDVRRFMERVNGFDDVRVAIITKGDMYYQNDKLETLQNYLDGKKWDSAYVVGDKTEEEYLKVLKAEGVAPREFVMIGDSVSSDINPVIKMGGEGILLKRPSREGILWSFEAAQALPGVNTVATLDEALEVLKSMSRPSASAAASAPASRRPRAAGL